VLPKVAQKIHKMEKKTRHGFMIYDVAHKNIESLAYQGFGSWLLHNQVIPKA
jgi:nucleoside-triphosphatase THEP1